ncbi:MAG: peroxiredoxin-like family protein [Verrucomicrobiota bacterium]
MSHSIKLESGGTIPPITLPLVQGGSVTLGERDDPEIWQTIIIYRGLHCPLCNKYLSRLEQLRDEFLSAGSEIVAVTGDPLEKAEAMVAKNDLTFRVAYGLSVEQMRELGLYVSQPRSAEETDRPFAEPATFAINSDDKIHLIEISNTPFNRADLKELVETIEWVRENDYPIRGTL